MGPGANPSEQEHSKPPMRLAQVPLPQTPAPLTHSSSSGNVKTVVLKCLDMEIIQILDKLNLNMNNKVDKIINYAEHRRGVKQKLKCCIMFACKNSLTQCVLSLTVLTGNVTESFRLYSPMHRLPVPSSV